MSHAIQRRILVVDDDASYRESMSRLLWTVKETFPAQVLEAADGQCAMEILRTEPVDCVLLDHRMPGGNGVDWIARFLAAVAYLPIVMVTGQGDEATAVNAMKQGAVDYLVKGRIGAEALQCAVTNAIEKTAMRQTVERQRAALLIAERHRGMIESLGAACHHLGQPMTVVTLCLDLMRRQKWAPQEKELVDQCHESVESVNDILRRLQTVGAYRTEPYLPAGKGEEPWSTDCILSIQSLAPDPPGDGSSSAGE